MNLLEHQENKLQDTFSDDFLWGVAISAKQAEGAQDRALTVADLQNYDPNDSAKVKGDLSLNELMDRLEHPDRYHFPKKLGIDFYHRYREDLKLLKEMGISCFRFSISWSRIYANGSEQAPSEQGLQFYDRLLDLLQEMEIEPIVTLYHDDMPVDLALRYNGFMSRHVVDLFVTYANLVMDRFQHKVTYWIPVNQINLTRIGLSSIGVIKDTVEDVETCKWQGVHHKFIACAKIKKIGLEIQPSFRFGAMLADFFVNPMTCKPEDVTFATEKNQMNMFFFADVQLRGEYPGYALRYFKDQNIPIELQEDDRSLIKTYTLDFLAISYYNSNVVSYEKNTMAIGNAEVNPYLEANSWGWTINPLGLYQCFLTYWDRYGKPLMIAENGFGQIEQLDEQNQIHDDGRIDYMREHVKALKKAVQHGVDVFAYCAWSPIDMVSSGTSEMKKRYGLIYNDQDDAGNGSHQRFPKDSFYWYQKVIQNNGRMV